MSFEFKSIFPHEKPPTEKKEISESDAETHLEQLLSDPANAFLTEVAMNKKVLDEAISPQEALAFAESRIRTRLERTLDVRKITHGYSEHIQVNPDAVLNTLAHIQKYAQEIGLGADGRVVIDTTDTVNINPEICYKFYLLEKVKRGRNSVVEEAELQSAFYEATQELILKDIGVPMPFYEIDVLNTQMIAMEKLHARSVDEVLRGIGSLPEWFDIDRFCNSLIAFLDAMHAQGLYHRDLHYGNIMISQHLEWQEGESMGYVIDFGLSGFAHENMEPYKKEVAGYTFTYDDDYGRISEMRKSLKIVRERRS